MNANTREDTMRLTDEQIRETVATMRISEADKAIILRRALAGEPAARFTVYARRAKS